MNAVKVSGIQALVGEALRFWFPRATILENYRPEWLFGMELDFYLPQHRLAVEVQGGQHFHYVAALQDSRAEFEAQQQRDERKARFVQNRGETLLAVTDVADLRRQLGHWRHFRRWAPLPAALARRAEAYEAARRKHTVRGRLRRLLQHLI